MTGLELKELIKKAGMPLTRLANELGMSKQALANALAVKSVKLEFIKRVAAIIDLPPALFLEEVSQPNERPHIPLEVAAGRTSGIAECVTIRDCEARPVIPMLADYDLTMAVSGISMIPHFNPGDVVALRKVRADQIRWGEAYVVSSTEGVALKRVYDGGDSLHLASYNAEEYPPYDLPKSDVLEIYKVVGLLRSFN